MEVRRGLRRVSLSLNRGGLSLAAMTARGLERDENGVISYVWLLVIVWVFLELQGKDMEIVERWCWHSAQRPLSLSLFPNCFCLKFGALQATKGLVLFLHRTFIYWVCFLNGVVWVDIRWSTIQILEREEL